MMEIIMVVSFLVLGFSVIIGMFASGLGQENTWKVCVATATLGLIVYLYVTVFYILYDAHYIMYPFYLGFPLLIYLVFAGSYISQKLSGGWTYSLFYPTDDRKTKKEHSIAKAHVKFGRYHQAIEEFRKALAENPDEIHLRWEIATVYAYNLKQYGKAVEELTAILKEKSKTTKELWVLAAIRAAEIYSKNLGDIDGARKVLHQVVDRYPNSRESMRAQVWLSGTRIDGRPTDRYYDIKIEGEYYRGVNQHLIEQWIETGQATIHALVLKDETGKWIKLGNMEEFTSFWPPILDEEQV